MAYDMKMGGGAMADEDQMGPPQTDDAPSPQQSEDDPVSVFLNKASLPAGKKYKEGDKITLTVESIDPETGDVEACIYRDGEGEQEHGSNSPSMAGFDAAMGQESE